MSNQTLTKDDIKHVAKLSNLPLSEAQLAKFQSEISNTVKYVTKLNEIDTAAVKPTFQTTALTNSWRDDVVYPSLSQLEALKSAKRTKDGYFVTERVL